MIVSDGVIQQRNYVFLIQAGIAEIFEPCTNIPEAAEKVIALVEQKQKQLSKRMLEKVMDNKIKKLGPIQEKVIEHIISTLTLTPGTFANNAEKNAWHKNTHDSFVEMYSAESRAAEFRKMTEEYLRESTGIKLNDLQSKALNAYVDHQFAHQQKYDKEAGIKDGLAEKDPAEFKASIYSKLMHKQQIDKITKDYVQELGKKHDAHPTPSHYHSANPSHHSANKDDKSTRR